MLENNVISVFKNVFLRVNLDLEDLCITSTSGVSLTRNLFIPPDVNEPFIHTTFTLRIVCTDACCLTRRACFYSAKYREGIKIFSRPKQVSQRAFALSTD